MLSKDELLVQISGTIGKMKVLELTLILKQGNFVLTDLIDLTFNESKDVAFRAAWILENMILQDPGKYTGDFDYILWRLKDVQHESCQRHYAKVLMHITGKKNPVTIKNKLDQTDMNPVIEKCFEWLIDSDIKIAVKCFSAEVLFNLHRRYDWIAEELANQLEFLMRNGGPGIQSKGKRLLKSLAK